MGELTYQSADECLNAKELAHQLAIDRYLTREALLVLFMNGRTVSSSFPSRCFGVLEKHC